VLKILYRLEDKFTYKPHPNCIGLSGLKFNY